MKNTKGVSVLLAIAGSLAVGLGCSSPPVSSAAVRPIPAVADVDSSRSDSVHLTVSRTRHTGDRRQGDSAVMITALIPSQGKLADLLKTQVATATALGRTPFVELGATWCENCHLLDTSLGDARMVDAFAGTYIIRLDIDQWGQRLLDTLGLSADQGVPAIYAVDTVGRGMGPDITIGLSATVPGWDWSPAKIAPAFKKYFGEHRWRL